MTTHIPKIGEADRKWFVIDARDRSKARHMAPAHGLTLERVVYGVRGRR